MPDLNRTKEDKRKSVCVGGVMIIKEKRKQSPNRNPWGLYKHVYQFHHQAVDGTSSSNEGTSRICARGRVKHDRRLKKGGEEDRRKVG